LLGGKSEVPGEEKDGRVRATEKQKHGERSEPCKRGPLPKDASRVERMERKLKTKVERPFTRDKNVWLSRCSADQASTRIPAVSHAGLEKVRGEWALVCMTHNLLKFHKICYE